jgi:hypothetical protein
MTTVKNENQCDMSGIRQSVEQCNAQLQSYALMILNTMCSLHPTMLHFRRERKAFCVSFQCSFFMMLSSLDLVA